MKDNHRHWEKICALIKLRRGGSCEQMSYDQILALEEEANNLHEDEIKSVQQNGHWVLLYSSELVSDCYTQGYLFDLIVKKGENQAKLHRSVS